MQKITFALLAVIVLNVRPPCPARDLPQGAQVRHGRLDIHTSDHAMLIEQHSAKAIVDWDSFDIGPGFGVDLQQPSSQATMLARVIGGVPSEICGRLTANGGFYLVNPAGILFANGATVDVNRLLATTQNITDEAFLANRLEFAGTDHADVVNCGSLSAEMVALIAQKVENHGEIAAPQSALVGGTAIRLHQFDNGGTLRIDFSKLDLNHCSTVINKGNIQAGDGTAVLTAGGGAGLIEANEGTVVARSAEFSGRNAALSRLGNIGAEEIVIDPTANLVIGPATAQSSGLGYGLTAQTVGAGEIEISAEAAQPEFTAGIGYGFHDQNGNGWTYLRREANTLGGVLDSYSYLDPVLTYYHDAYLNTQLNQQAITLQYNRHGTTDGAIAVVGADCTIAPGAVIPAGAMIEESKDERKESAK